MTFVIMPENPPHPSGENRIAVLLLLSADVLLEPAVGYHVPSSYDK